MRKNNFILYFLLILPALLLQSCLKDQEDTFSDSASVRMQKYIATAKAALTNDAYGWVMDYYPEVNQSYGGYSYFIKFDAEKAAVASESSISNDTITSYYNIVSDDGPILTFDTYNSNMHAFATPSSSQYQGLQGDYEFIIMKVEDGLITLKGKKTGNTMYLRKLTADGSAYVEAQSKIIEKFVVAGFKSTIDGKSVLVDLNVDNRQLTFNYTDASGVAQSVSSAYLFTNTGIRLYKEITIGAKKFQNFTFDTESYKLTCTDNGATDVVLAGYFPEDYVSYADYAGNYVLSYGTKDGKTDFKVNVTLTPGEKNKTYILSGLNANFTLVLNYSLNKGNLNLVSQPIGKNGNNVVWFCAWTLAGGGTLTWSTAAGMSTSWNQDKDNFVLTFANNGNSTYAVDSFIIWQLTSSGSSAGEYSGWKIGTSGTSRMRYIHTLTKIK